MHFLLRIRVPPDTHGFSTSLHEQFLMRTLKEYFADYAPVLPSLFSLNHAPSTSRPLYGNSANSWDPAALDRAVQGVTAVLLSLKKKPIIRYEKSSPMAKKLGVEVQVSTDSVKR